MIRHRRVALHGVSGAGLSTTVQPAASAGPSLARLIWCGKFHGVIAPTTPAGLALVSSGGSSPRTGLASPRSVSQPLVALGQSAPSSRGPRPVSRSWASRGQEARRAHLGDGQLPQLLALWLTSASLSWRRQRARKASVAGPRRRRRRLAGGGDGSVHVGRRCHPQPHRAPPRWRG
jgi:hypothetical protein